MSHCPHSLGNRAIATLAAGGEVGQLALLVSEAGVEHKARSWHALAMPSHHRN
jgi:hypothetical protein